MDRHEQIKQECVQILNYYYVNADTEFTLLHSNERIDVVGYYQSKRAPDIGIEVQRTDKFQHDAAKLTNLKSLTWRFVVSEDSDTLSLGKDASINGEQIKIFLPPDQDISFEKYIREITTQTTRKWFNQFKKDTQPQLEQFKKDALSSLENEINEQNLSMELVNDILFEAALGGIYAGAYFQGKTGTEYHKSIDMPRELLYLKARNLIFEDRPGRSYDTGRLSLYYLTEEGSMIARNVIQNRVIQNCEAIDNLKREAGSNALFFSVIGTMGRFIDRTDVTEFLSKNLYSIIPLPSITLSLNNVPRDLVEEFNINPELFYMSNLIASSPAFKNTVSKIYSALVEAHVGHKTGAFSSRGDSIGTLYATPIRAILREINVEEWLETLNLGQLKIYCEWLILRSHNPVVPNTLFDSLKAIGADSQELEQMISQLFEKGITSGLLKNGSNTIAIYDQDKFNEYCESKLLELLPKILD